MSDKPDSKGVRIDGVKAVADMLNVMDEANRERLLAGVAEKDPKLAATIRKRLFTFLDLIRLDARDAQVLFRELPRGLLPLALRNAPGDFIKFVFSNISEVSGRLLRDELASQGPKRVSEIEAAQEKIIELARKLGGEGKISLRL